MKYQPVIGLEVHVELKTKSKMFCGCSADYFGKEPNTHTCPVCLGLPGALPVPNRKAIEWCVMVGLALNCEIPLFSKFDRKNYFYPDLPKGYQISQYDKPFCVNGWININTTNTTNATNTTNKRIRIRRVHMEEDTAKLVHASVNGENVSLIDFNRSGVPLVEIVTEPDFESAEEVVEYLKKIQQIVRYLGVSNADMERGDMRLEPNVSLLPYTSGEPFGHPRGGRMDSSGVELPGYKVEVKNINSFRFVEKAINYEIDRQRQLLEKGETPRQETRGWSEEKNATLPQRGKEEAHDYRYFPEPDIPPVRWTVREVGKIREQLPELPDVKLDRFKKDYTLPDYDAEILTRERSVADYFEESIRIAQGVTGDKQPFDFLRLRSGQVAQGKQIANWIINKKVDIEKVLPAELIQTIISQTQTITIDEQKLEEIVNQVLLDNPNAVSDYIKGKEQVIMFLVGQVMRNFKEKIDAKIVREKIMQKIKEKK